MEGHIRMLVAAITTFWMLSGESEAGRRSESSRERGWGL